MSMPEDSALESQLRECVCDAVPPDVEARLRARLAEFRSRLNARETVAATPARRARLTARWKLGLACAAAGLFVAALGLLLWPRTSLADVAAAVLQQSWIHLRIAGAGDGDSDSEFWYSPARNIVATRWPNWTTYQDYRLQVVDWYDTRDKVVYHLPTVSWNSGAARALARESVAMVEALATLLEAERLPEKPLAHLDFLGPQRTTMRVLDQRMEKITEAGHNWLDCRLTVAGPSPEQPLRMFFRVDAATKLPALCRFDRQYDGKPATVETRIDYPERGPADLYDLGVPRTAQRVDRVPVGDLKRIMDTIMAGRERMDDYRAVFVRDMPGRRWWTAQPIIVYRKGKKFRLDFPVGWTGNLLATKGPDQGEDPVNWWRERAKFFQFFPKYVARGGTTFVSEVKDSKNPDGTLDAEIVSVSSRQGPELFPPGLWMWPEFACRQNIYMVLSNPHMEPALELHPTDGPPGSIRVSMRRTSQRDRINEKGIGIPDESRYWLDPQRDFIVVRQDRVVRDRAGQEKVIQRDTVEETARSPQGIWYATKIRRSSLDQAGKAEVLSRVEAEAGKVGRPIPPAVGEAKFVGHVDEFYVDFDVNLPDSLFEPPKPGKIR
jgi:hypothetical protein